MKYITFIVIFLLSATASATFPTGWNRRCAVAIQSSKVSTTLTDYPLLLTEACLPLEMFDTTGGNAARPDGGDVRFSSDADGNTELAFELTHWENADSTAQIWVKVPSISSSVNTTIYVWYDSSAATAYAETDTYGKHAVWTSNYKAVWHFEELPSGSANDTMFDATSNSNDAVSAGGFIAADQVTGVVSYGLDFDSDSDDHLNPGDIDIDSFITLSLWHKPKVDSHIDHSIAHVVSKSGSYLWREVDTMANYMDTGFYFTIVDEGGGDFEANNNARLTSGTWYYGCGTYDGSYVRLYMDGVCVDSTAHTGDIDLNDNVTNIGGYNDGTIYQCEAVLDELRLYRGVRSIGWILSEYNNMDSPSTFVVEGTPCTPGEGVGKHIRKVHLRKIKL